MIVKSFLLKLLIAINIQFFCSVIDPNEPGALVPKTVDHDTTLPIISVNGDLLYAETFGTPNNSMAVYLNGDPNTDYRNALNAKQ